MQAPAAFQRSITEHNKYCWFSAFSSWLGAFVAWLVFTGIYVALALVFENVRTGDASLTEAPFWLVPLGGGVALVMLVWASVERWRTRYQPTSDRSIIGWHLFGDFLLLPARLTFAIWDHIGLRIKLNAGEREDAWFLLQVISRNKRVAMSALGQEFSDTSKLPKLLMALQLTGWIDLQRGDEDWFYYVPSDRQERLDEALRGEF